MISYLAENFDLSKKTVGSLLDSLTADIIPSEIKKFKKINFLNILKLSEKIKPATKARKGNNPFTGEATVFKARPRSKTVKALALKRLKDSLS